MKSTKIKLIVSTLILLSTYLVWFSFDDPGQELAPLAFTPLPLIPAIALVVFLLSLFTYIRLKFGEKLAFADKELKVWQLVLAALGVYVSLHILDMFFG